MNKEALKLLGSWNYDHGVDTSHLNLLYKSDETSNISIKTPFGKTERVTVTNTIPQGDVPAPFKCTTQVDKIRRITQRLMERFQKLATTVNRPSKPCSATAENNIDDDIDIVNHSNVSVVDLDL